jgi:L-iditol 2-dehydrogenase
VPNEPFLFDDSVVVLGVGPLGMCFLMKARMLGAGTIVAVDLSAYRLAMAARLGADHIVDASRTTLRDRLAFVREATRGRGADVVVECAGVPQVIPEALEMLRTGGMLVEAGNFSDLGEVAINPHRHLCSKNVRILGVGGEEAASYGPSMRQLLRYMRHYPVREFVSHCCRLDDVDAAVAQSIAPDSMKVVIDPWA